MSKMVLGYTTNITESFNSVLWSIIEKKKFHGRKHQEIAVMIALLQYQDGFSSAVRMMNQMIIDVTSYALNVFLQLDKDRSKCRDRKN